VGIAFVQGKLGSATSASVTGNSATLTSPVTSGNMLCGMATAFGPASSVTIGITDDKGNTYTIVGNNNYNTFTELFFFFYCLNITNGPQTITSTLSGGNTGSYVGIIADEFSGVATTSAFDQTASAQPSGVSGTDSASSGSATTTAPGELIYGMAVNFTNVSTAAGTNFTYTEHETNTLNAELGAEYYIQPSAGAIAATFSPSGSSQTLISMMTFKAAAGAADVLASQIWL
jgi:hypothetical protein